MQDFAIFQGWARRPEQRRSSAQGLPGFFKLRHSPKVKELLARMQRAQGKWFTNRRRNPRKGRP
jgi:hypothetical protein